MSKFAKELNYFVIFSYHIFQQGVEYKWGKRIIRIAHGQSEKILIIQDYQHLKNMLNQNQDKYDVQIFPNELLDLLIRLQSWFKLLQLILLLPVQVILKLFDNVYQIFSIPYLFDSVDVYHKVMEDDELMSSIFESTESQVFRLCMV